MIGPTMASSFGHVMPTGPFETPLECFDALYYLGAGGAADRRHPGQPNLAVDAQCAAPVPLLRVAKSRSSFTPR
jgi:hypothetical protein